MFEGYSTKMAAQRLKCKVSIRANKVTGALGGRGTVKEGEPHNVNNLVCINGCSFRPNVLA